MLDLNNIRCDVFSFTFIMWNFTVVGVSKKVLICFSFFAHDIWEGGGGLQCFKPPVIPFWNYNYVPHN